MLIFRLSRQLNCWQSIGVLWKVGAIVDIEDCGLWISRCYGNFTSLVWYVIICDMKLYLEVPMLFLKALLYFFGYSYGPIHQDISIFTQVFACMAQTEEQTGIWKLNTSYYNINPFNKFSIYRRTSLNILNIIRLTNNLRCRLPEDYLKIIKQINKINHYIQLYWYINQYSRLSIKLLFSSHLPWILRCPT